MVGTLNTLHDSQRVFLISLRIYGRSKNEIRKKTFVVGCRELWISDEKLEGRNEAIYVGKHPKIIATEWFPENIANNPENIQCLIKKRTGLVLVLDHPPVKLWTFNNIEG